MKKQELKQALQSVLTLSEDGKYDLLPVYADPQLFNAITDTLAEGYAGKVDYILMKVKVESEKLA